VRSRLALGIARADGRSHGPRFNNAYRRHDRTAARTRPGRLALQVIGLHARIIGRPARIGGLDAVLRPLDTCGAEVWVARREDLARHWLAQA
jgi:hypothetical protein